MKVNVSKNVSLSQAHVEEAIKLGLINETLLIFDSYSHSTQKLSLFNILIVSHFKI